MKPPMLPGGAQGDGEKSVKESFVDNVSFLGKYIIRDLAAMDSMPAYNASGVWRVWRLEDGRLMTQPLDDYSKPCGNVHPLAGEDFARLLLALPGEEFSAREPPPQPARPEDEELKIPASGQPLQPDDLLDIWYEQALAASGDEGKAGAGSAGPAASENAKFFASPPADAAPKAIAGDEKLFFPVWSPDDVFSLPDAEQSPPERVSNGPGARSQGPALPPGGGAQRLPDLFSATAPVNRLPGFPAAPMSGEAGKATRGGAPEEKNLADSLEQDFREKFTALAEHLDGKQQAAMEKMLLQLLRSKDGRFTWKQKFMFTDFGRELRRRRKPRLALESHLRALELAPNDEHILFNVARAAFDLGDIETAKECLNRALAVSPDFAAAGTFLNFLQGVAH